MHLFTRTCQVDILQGPETLILATDMAHLASKVTGLEVIPWTSVFGLPLGTVVYGAQVESQAAVADALAKLSADPGYQRLVAESGGRLHTGPGEDAIAELVSFAGSGESTGNLASVVVAQCAPGRIAEATAWGVDILSHASKTTGLDGSFLRALYGRWPTLVWISLAETMEEVDIATASLAADGTYVERIDDAGPLFLAGSASQRLLRRLT
jgi:hypothetical protein